MTIIEAINKIDALVPNMYLLQEKLSWLSRVDSLLDKEVISTHEPNRHFHRLPGIIVYRDEPVPDPEHGHHRQERFHGYDENTPQDTVLIAPEPYDDLYIYFMQMQIDYFNGEYDKYNNSAQMFQSAYDAFKNYWNRTHTPKTARNNYY